VSIRLKQKERGVKFKGFLESPDKRDGIKIEGREPNTLRPGPYTGPWGEGVLGTGSYNEWKETHQNGNENPSLPPFATAGVKKLFPHPKTGG